MRYPAVAGQFYPSERNELKDVIKQLFLGPLGPGLLPHNFSGEKTVHGVVSPHAGYTFSGQVAAHSYLEMSKGEKPDVIIIIGPNHTGMGSPVSATIHDYLTPLGTAHVDAEMVGEIIQETGGLVTDDVRAHRYEHSVEVQVPFIQFIDEDVPIVPIIMMDQRYETAVRLGAGISGATEAMDKRIFVVASSDFSHYVPPEVARREDGLAIERILEKDPEGLYSTIRRRKIGMCGYGPVMTLLEIAKRMGATDTELLKYATSGDIQPMDDVVGYASIAIYGE